MFGSKLLLKLLIVHCSNHFLIEFIVKVKIITIQWKGTPLNWVNFYYRKKLAPMESIKRHSYIFLRCLLHLCNPCSIMHIMASRIYSSLTVFNSFQTIALFRIHWISCIDFFSTLRWLSQNVSFNCNAATSIMSNDLNNIYYYNFWTKNMLPRSSLRTFI